jgi:hypothetical protein
VRGELQTLEARLHSMSLSLSHGCLAQAGCPRLFMGQRSAVESAHSTHELKALDQVMWGRETKAPGALKGRSIPHADGPYRWLREGGLGVGADHGVVELLWADELDVGRDAVGRAEIERLLRLCARMRRITIGAAVRSCRGLGRPSPRASR